MLGTKYVTDNLVKSKHDGYRVLKMNVDTSKRINSVLMLIKKTYKGNQFLGIKLLDKRDKTISSKIWDEDPQGVWVK